MKLSNEQQTKIRECLKDYLLSGGLKRETDTPILVGSKITDLFVVNDDFFDDLKLELEITSGEKLDWIVGMDGTETFMGLTVIHNVVEQSKDFYGVKKYRFVIELRGVRA